MVVSKSKLAVPTLVHPLEARRRTKPTLATSKQTQLGENTTGGRGRGVASRGVPQLHTYVLSRQ